MTLEELMEAPIPKSWINEPIDYAVDFVVKETALQRAHRRWGMTSDGRKMKALE
jgi:hypothetical protein